MHTKLTISQASQKLNKSPHSVKRWINQGKLNGEKLNGKWFVISDDKFEHHLHTNGHMPDVHPHTSESISDTHLHTEIKYLKTIISEKDRQIAERDKQIESLLQQLDHQSQLQAMSQQTIQQLTEQNQLLIEDKSRQSWWQRLLRKS